MPKKDPDLWRCPECGRRFTKKNQWHSCLTCRVEDHFRGRQARLRKTFDELLRKLKGVGEVRVDAVKSSINLASRYHFAGVSVRKDHLVIGFVSNGPITGDRIQRTIDLGGGKVSCCVKLRSPADVDDQLLTWLRRSYDLQS